MHREYESRVHTARPATIEAIANLECDFRSVEYALELLALPTYERGCVYMEAYALACSDPEHLTNLGEAYIHEATDIGLIEIPAMDAKLRAELDARAQLERQLLTAGSTTNEKWLTQNRMTWGVYRGLFTMRDVETAYQSCCRTVARRALTHYAQGDECHPELVTELLKEGFLTPVDIERARLQGATLLRRERQQQVFVAYLLSTLRH